MREIWIVVDGSVDATSDLVAPSPTTAAMVAAIEQAIATHSSQNVIVRVVSSADLVNNLDAEDILLYPLTLNLPTGFSFSHQDIYQACRDVSGLRHLVEQKWGYPTKTGSFWLPVVRTVRGSLYGEAIGLSNQKANLENLSLESLNYSQPIHLSDARRQQIYEFAHELLKLLAAPPATYLLQFGMEGKDIYFDRLWPFPAAPALASLGVQTPDLFTCHLHCLTGLPIYDLVIIP